MQCYLNELCGVIPGAKGVMNVLPYKQEVISSTSDSGSVTTVYEIYSDGMYCDDEWHPGKLVEHKVEIIKTVSTVSGNTTLVERTHALDFWKNRATAKYVPACHPVDWDPVRGVTHRLHR